MRIDAEFFGKVSVGAAIAVEAGNVAVAIGLQGSLIARVRGFRGVNCGVSTGWRGGGTRKRRFQDVREFAHLLGSESWK